MVALANARAQAVLRWKKFSTNENMVSLVSHYFPLHENYAITIANVLVRKISYIWVTSMSIINLWPNGYRAIWKWSSILKFHVITKLPQTFHESVALMVVELSCHLYVNNRRNNVCTTTTIVTLLNFNLATQVFCLHFVNMLVRLQSTKFFINVYSIIETTILSVYNYPAFCVYLK
jgi:hypothetical protein